MSNRIIVCGGNGVGKSTLGKRLAEELGYIFKDIEEYYFLVCNTDYNATVKFPENFTLTFAVRE